MATYNINQYQYHQFSYADTTAGLYINNQPANIGFTFNIGVDYTFEVDVFTNAGSYVFDVYDSLGNPYDTITLNVGGVLPNITHTLCLSDELGRQFLPSAPVGSWQLSGNYFPSWLNLGLGQYSITNVTNVGEFFVLFEDDTDPLNNVYLVKFVFDSCLTEYSFCSKWNANLVWLNLAGGWSSYCFKGRKTYGVEVGDKRMYKTSNRTRKYYNILDVYDTIEILSGEIPVSHAEFIKSLKYSVQVYLFRNGTFTPVIVTDASFTLYTDGDGLMKYDVAIQYAQETKIQTQ